MVIMMMVTVLVVMAISGSARPTQVAVVSDGQPPLIYGEDDVAASRSELDLSSRHLHTSYRHTIQHTVQQQPPTPVCCLTDLFIKEKWYLFLPHGVPAFSRKSLLKQYLPCSTANHPPVCGFTPAKQNTPTAKRLATVDRDEWSCPNSTRPELSMGWVDPWVGLGQSADGLGWIGSHKMDPWTTLHQTGPTRLCRGGDRRLGARSLL